MIQFTKAQITQLQKKRELWPEAISQLKEEVSEVMAEPVLVPKTGIANWFLYYYCPKCSVQLEFNRMNGHYHKCPACGQAFTGEPYDSTWWGIINSRNYTTAFKMGLLYLVTKEETYAKKAISIMTEYSKYYKDYEVHGDIPYNGPGKSGAQTLDEANFLRSFAMTYDLLSDVMTKAEQTFIRDGMLLPGAEFLMEHRHNQLHNHEVIINSAIAIIGLIFHMDSYVKFAVYEPYGLLYQLEHGMLQNHMWFEGAFGYHFYALTSFFAYEKFALHTPHSHISHPNYKAMMELLVDYLEPGFRIPMLNDTNYGHTSSSLYLYEFAYREIGGEKLLYILNELYKNEKRDNVEAFIYGVDELTPCVHLSENYHVEEGLSGNTILRGANGRYLLFKHDSYGGEHDHYDRLDISYLAYGKRLSPDLGTTGYGALLHYDYYKNTGSHNTVMIGEENQAPVNAVLKRYEELDGVIYAEAQADWTAPYTMPDSYTIVQWKEEHYRSVKMTRKIAWTDDYFAEVFLVTGADPDLAIDWVMHVSGENILAFNGRPAEGFSVKKPYRHLHSIKEIKSDSPIVTAYQDGEVTTHIFGYGFGQTVYSAKGPDNPSISDINYRIERSFGGEAMFAHVITSSDGACKVGAVSFEALNGSMMIHVKEADGRERKLFV
ncbi:alginate lyase [Lacrimispora amygdalina]|uniref:Alginate lyase n=1 Tax=Lacrimispora amygdalina TaxID=253257 RepID=A0ABQ5M319_9FIRM